MATSNSGETTGSERDGFSDPRGQCIMNNFFGPVDNCNFGGNRGNIIQHKQPVATPQEPLILPGSRNDIYALLNPIPNASHTRDLKVAPPNSQCFPGTRQSVMKDIRDWANSSLVLGNNPHIMWIYGFAGCGKSAIAQEAAQYFDRKGRLAAAFFFFRGSGDRSRVEKFANTVAHQVATAIQAAAPFIEAALRANPNLATNHTSLSVQFERLVYAPINSVKWDRLGASLRHGPFIIVLDGLDECEDHSDIATFIEKMIEFFRKKPRTPLRFLVTSRVESHIHQQLHSSKQVRLLDLVDHTSDADIAAALDAAFKKEMRNRTLTYVKNWPSQEDKMKLVKHIGGSYIFMTTLIRLLFDPYLNDGLTPMARLPLLLQHRPDFDSLYKAILAPSSHLPHFHSILSTVALALEPLSVAQIAELLEIDSADVVNTLSNFHAIMQIPGDDHMPITLWHTSLRDFLCSKDRSGDFHATTAHRRWLSYRCMSLLGLPGNSASSATQVYAGRLAISHWLDFIRTTAGNTELFKSELTTFVNHLRECLPRTYHSVLFARFSHPPQASSGTVLCDALSQLTSWESLQSLLKGSHDMSRLIGLQCPDGPTKLEVAARARNWKTVRDLVEAGENINGLFYSAQDGMIVVLHAACLHQEWKLIHFLLDKGADPNILSPNTESGGFDDGTPLSFAAWNGDVQLATRLLECSADPNVQGLVVLQVWQVKCGSLQVERRLGGFYGTALQAACVDGSLKMVELLLDHGADPNLGDGNQSPLHSCARRGHQDCARALMMCKADPNLQDNEGDTPLHDACRWGYAKVVECLLEFKADASIKNNQGHTALQVAQKEWQDHVVELLQRHGIHK